MRFHELLSEAKERYASVGEGSAAGGADPWYVSLFDDRYLLLFEDLEKLLEQTEVEAAFVERATNLPEGASVLDLGCGFGRHAIALAQRGFAVTGFDRSSALLDMGQKAGAEVGTPVQWHQGDMRDLGDLGEFDLCVCLATVFGYFSDDENRSVLRQILRHLKPKGQLLLDVFNPLALLQRGTSSSYTRRNRQGVVHEQRIYQPLTGRLLTLRHFEGNDGRSFEYPNSDVRMYAPHELATLLESAGFAVQGIFGSLTGSPFAWQESGVQVWLVRRSDG